MLSSRARSSASLNFFQSASFPYASNSTGFAPQSSSALPGPHDLPKNDPNAAGFRAPHQKQPMKWDITVSFVPRLIHLRQETESKTEMRTSGAGERRKAKRKDLLTADGRGCQEKRNKQTKQANQASKQETKQANKKPSKQTRNQAKQARNQASKRASEQASERASKRASKQASEQASRGTDPQASKQANKQTNKQT